MSFTTPALRTTAVTAAALLALTACGGDNGDEDAEDVNDETTEETTDDEGGEDSEAGGESGSLSIALNGEEPYSWIDDSGEATGATIAVAEEVFQNRMGYDVEFIEEPEWGNLIPGLNAGHWDVVSAGMSINAERCAEADFGAPELVYTTAFLVEEGNPEGVENFEDLLDADLDVVALNGAVESDWMNDVGVEHDTVNSSQDGIDFVDGGAADVFALTAISLEAMAGDIDGLEVTEPFAHELSVGAHAFLQGEDELVEEFNGHIEELMDSGEYLDIVGEYGFTEAEIPPSGLTAQELCDGDPAELAEEYLDN